MALHPRKVALLGTAGTLAVPPDPEEWEWWGFGPAGFFQADQLAKGKGERVSRHLKRWYELHDPDGIEGEYPSFAEQEPRYLDWLKTLDCPVYMHRHYPEIPNSVPYPKDEIQRIFGKHHGGTSCWAACHAIYEHVCIQPVSDMGLWGVHCSTDGEYAAERGPLLFYLGWAAGMGIRLELYDILLPIMEYGYGDAKNLAA